MTMIGHISREEVAPGQDWLEEWIRDLLPNDVAKWVDQQHNASLAKVQKPLVDALKWLDEFVVEPEYFPGDGDRQWWQEKRRSITLLAQHKEKP